MLTFVLIRAHTPAAATLRRARANTKPSFALEHVEILLVNIIFMELLCSALAPRWGLSLVIKIVTLNRFSTWTAIFIAISWDFSSPIASKSGYCCIRSHRPSLLQDFTTLGTSLLLQQRLLQRQSCILPVSCATALDGQVLTVTHLSVDVDAFKLELIKLLRWLFSN